MRTIKTPPFRRASSGSPVRRRQLGVDTQHGPNTPLRNEAVTDTELLKANISLCWTVPYKVFQVAPSCSVDTPGGFDLSTIRLQLYLP